MPRLIVRPPGPTFTDALSQHPERLLLDPAAAGAQHAAFVRALRAAGCDLLELPPHPTLPDATFVSDCLMLLEDGRLQMADGRHGVPLGVLTRPGAPTRRDEVASVADAARSWAPALSFAWIEDPGTLDGGDVVVFGSHIAIGLSERTNEEGARQLGAHAASLGYSVHLCPVADRLHLASEVTAIGPRRLVGTPSGFASLEQARDGAGWLDGVERILVSPEEAPAANVLAVNGVCVMAAGYPAARTALEAAGETVVEVELGQFTRADGGPTCLVAFVSG